MIRCCFLGNSHLAAIKDGWELARKQWPGIEVTFFGSPKRKLEGLRLDGRALVPETDDLRRDLHYTSGGKQKIVLDDYDIIGLFGLGCGIRHVLRIYRSYRTAEHRITFQRKFLISDECLRESAQAALSCSVGCGLARLITSVTDKRLFSYADPMPPRLFEEGGPDPEEIVRSGDDRKLAATFELARRSAFPAGVELLGQPACTRVGEIFTKPVYQSARPGDTTHMNGEYGAIVLGDVLAHLKASRAEKAA